MKFGRFLTHSSLLIAGLIATSAQAAIFTYSDFSDLSDWQLNGATALINPGGTGVTGPNPGDGKVLRLTNDYWQSGSAFLSNAISLQNQASFSAKFDFQFTNQGNTGADGIVFTVQTVSNTAGGVGGGIGYTGLGNSVGVEFDNWDNGPGYGDPNANHAAIDYNGSFSPIGPLVADLSTLGIDLDLGNILTAWIDYNGLTDLLEVRVTNAGGARPTSALLSDTVDLAAILGSNSAYVGFTSGTGAAKADHDIRNLVFENNFNSGGAGSGGSGAGVPVPAPVTLLGLGLLGLAGMRRR